MNRAVVSVWILALIAIASAAVGCGQPAPASAGTSGSPAAVATTPGPTPASATPIASHLSQAPATASATPVPSDVPFTVDCSALPASRQADCDAFIAATRDQAYPLLIEATGVHLSACYPGIKYVILTGNPKPEAGGLDFGATIELNEAYSVDMAHRYDVHELLHSISSCARALDSHVFHGMILNYVYDRLGVHDAGFFTDRSDPDLNQNLDFLLQKVKTASGSDLAGFCVGILQRKTTIAYFDLGAEAVKPLYRSTLNAPTTLSAPNAQMAAEYGPLAQQIEALVETLRNSYHYGYDVPECGLPAA